MPPDPFVAAGRDKVVKSWIDGGFGAPPHELANRLDAFALPETVS